MKQTVFSTYKRCIGIGFKKNKIFYMTESRLPQLIISLGAKFDIIFVIVSLKTDTCSLTSKSMSADSQLSSQLLFFIWSEFTWEKCQTVLS